MQHWCWWNRNVANPIRAHGYQGKGRKALMVLKHQVLEQTLLRRTKQQRADDLALPPRFTYMRRDVLDEVEEDFYQGLYTCVGCFHLTPDIAVPCDEVAWCCAVLRDALPSGAGAVAEEGLRGLVWFCSRA